MCIRDSDYAMRLWLNPGKLATRGLTASDVINAVREQNVHCLLYTSDAADERSSGDLGGRRIIKKKNTTPTDSRTHKPEENATTRTNQIATIEE